MTPRRRPGIWLRQILAAALRRVQDWLARAIAWLDPTEATADADAETVAAVRAPSGREVLAAEAPPAHWLAHIRRHGGARFVEANAPGHGAETTERAERSDMQEDAAPAHWRRDVERARARVRFRAATGWRAWSVRVEQAVMLAPSQARAWLRTVWQWMQRSVRRLTSRSSRQREQVAIATTEPQAELRARMRDDVITTERDHAAQQRVMTVGDDDGKIRRNETNAPLSHPTTADSSPVRLTPTDRPEHRNGISQTPALDARFPAYLPARDLSYSPIKPATTEVAGYVPGVPLGRTTPDNQEVAGYVASVPLGRPTSDSQEVAGYVPSVPLGRATPDSQEVAGYVPGVPLGRLTPDNQEVAGYVPGVPLGRTTPDNQEVAGYVASVPLGRPTSDSQEVAGYVASVPLGRSTPDNHNATQRHGIAEPLPHAHATASTADNTVVITPISHAHADASRSTAVVSSVVITDSSPQSAEAHSETDVISSDATVGAFAPSRVGSSTHQDVTTTRHHGQSHPAEAQTQRQMRSNLTTERRATTTTPDEVVLPTVRVDGNASHTTAPTARVAHTFASDTDTSHTATDRDPLAERRHEPSLTASVAHSVSTRQDMPTGVTTTVRSRDLHAEAGSSAVASSSITLATSASRSTSDRAMTTVASATPVLPSSGGLPTSEAKSSVETVALSLSAVLPTSALKPSAKTVATSLWSYLTRWVWRWMPGHQTARQINLPRTTALPARAETGRLATPAHLADAVVEPDHQRLPLAHSHAPQERVASTAGEIASTRTRPMAGNATQGNATTRADLTTTPHSDHRRSDEPTHITTNSGNAANVGGLTHADRAAAVATTTLPRIAPPSQTIGSHRADHPEKITTASPADWTWQPCPALPDELGANESESENASEFAAPVGHGSASDTASHARFDIATQRHPIRHPSLVSQDASDPVRRLDRDISHPSLLPSSAAATERTTDARLASPRTTTVREQDTDAATPVETGDASAVHRAAVSHRRFAPSQVNDVADTAAPARATTTQRGTAVPARATSAAPTSEHPTEPRTPSNTDTSARMDDVSHPTSDPFVTPGTHVSEHDAATPAPADIATGISSRVAFDRPERGPHRHSQVPNVSSPASAPTTSPARSAEALWPSLTDEASSPASLASVASATTATPGRAPIPAIDHSKRPQAHAVPSTLPGLLPTAATWPTLPDEDVSDADAHADAGDESSTLPDATAHLARWQEGWSWSA